MQLALLRAKYLPSLLIVTPIDRPLVIKELTSYIAKKNYFIKDYLIAVKVNKVLLI